MDELEVDFAYKECVVHSQIKHENVVKLFDYSENDTEFVLFMEYCNDAGYFNDKIMEVSPCGHKNQPHISVTLNLPIFSPFALLWVSECEQGN